MGWVSFGHRRKERLAVDEERLLKLLRYLSRYRACRATNQTLANRLGWSIKRLKNCLRRLRNRMVVKSTGRRVVTLVVGRKKWHTERTIYLVSRVEVAQGALMVANLVPERQPDRSSRDEMCGRLQCTPDQLGQWLREAEQRGYVVCVTDQDGQVLIFRKGTFPVVSLPEPTWTLLDAQPLRSSSALEQLLNLVRKSENREAGVFFSATDAELGGRLNTGRARAQQVRTRAIRGKLLHCWREGGKWVMSMSPRPVDGPGATSPSPVEHLLWPLRVHGPLIAVALRTFARLPADAPLPMKHLREAGVCSTRFGNLRFLSLGPLPREFIESQKERQRQRKAEKDKARRTWKKLGLVPSDEYVLCGARPLLQNLCFRAFQFSFGGPQLGSLQSEARAFAHSISNEDLAVHLVAARAESNTSDVTADQVAAKVFAAVREEFAGRAHRLQRELRAALFAAAG